VARVAPEELATTRSAVIVDIRHLDEREMTGWIPGSIWHPQEEDLEAWARTLPTGAPIVLVCMTGRRSLEVVEALQGHLEHGLIDLEGGTMAWAAAGLPLVRADRSALSDTQAGDLRALTLEEFQRDVLSCFVATALKVDADHRLEGDLTSEVYETFDEALDRQAQARHGVDRLAAQAFAEGYPLDVIAENCCFYYQLAGHIQGR